MDVKIFFLMIFLISSSMCWVDIPNTKVRQISSKSLTCLLIPIFCGVHPRAPGMSFQPNGMLDSETDIIGKKHRIIILPSNGM